MYVYMFISYFLQQFDWMNCGSLNSLNDVYQHHCKGLALDKDIRQVFVKGTVEDINQDFQVFLRTWLLCFVAGDTVGLFEVICVLSVGLARYYVFRCRTT